MPINKMQSRNIDPNVVRQIGELTGGAARLAQDLIEFDPKFQPVMK